MWQKISRFPFRTYDLPGYKLLKKYTIAFMSELSPVKKISIPIRKRLVTLIINLTLFWNWYFLLPIIAEWATGVLKIGQTFNWSIVKFSANKNTTDIEILTKNLNIYWKLNFLNNIKITHLTYQFTNEHLTHLSSISFLWVLLILRHKSLLEEWILWILKFLNVFSKKLCLLLIASLSWEEQQIH